MYLDQILFSTRKYSSKQLLILVLIVPLIGLGILVLYRELYFNQSITQISESIKIPFYFFFLIIVSILLFKVPREISDFLKRNKEYKFTRQSWIKDWIFNGKTEILDDEELFVKSSRAGCLLKKYLWKNFILDCELKFEPNRIRTEKNIGLIFRANDLDNYFMVEIIQDNKYKGEELITGLKPHVRFESGWEQMDIEEIFFDFSTYKKIRLAVKDESASLYIESNEPIFNWYLPTHVDVNHIESGVVRKENQDSQNIIGENIAKNVQELPFRLDYGMIGFRAHPRQGALIKGLKISPQ